MPRKSNWNARVKEALDRTNIMALSTLGADGSWTSPVEYTYSPKLELSFLSMIDTRHVANLLADSRVSLAIYNPEPLPGGGSLGLQVKGRARLASRAGKDGWHTFTITPDEVWCFDSRISRKRHKIDLAKLKI